MKTDRLLLRDITQSDIHHIYNGLSHPDVIKYYGVSYDTLEATQEQMDWFADNENAGTGKWFAVCSLDGSVFYGAGGYNDVDKINRRAEIGFWLLPEYWGKGIMGEAMPIIFQYGFDVLNLHRIEGFVESGNEKCKSAVAKVGFIYEGTMSDSEFKNGEFVNVDIFAKFNPKTTK